MTKHLKKLLTQNPKRFILGLSVRGFGLHLAGSIIFMPTARQSHQGRDSWEREMEPEGRRWGQNQPQSHAHDPFSSARPPCFPSLPNNTVTLKSHQWIDYLWSLGVMVWLHLRGPFPDMAPLRLSTPKVTERPFIFNIEHTLTDLFLVFVLG